MSLDLIAILISALIGAISAYAVSRNNTSTQLRIAHDSEEMAFNKQLLEYSSQIKEDLEALRKDNVTLLQKNIELSLENQKLRERIVSLESQVFALTESRADLANRIIKLEANARNSS